MTAVRDTAIANAATESPLNYGIYFIDVLACLLFFVPLALAGARFDRERSVRVELPRLEPTAASGSEIKAQAIVLRSSGDELELFFGDEPVSFEELEARLRAAPPPAVTLRSEASDLARVIALAHAAGVDDIQLAYAVGSQEETTP